MQESGSASAPKVTPAPVLGEWQRGTQKTLAQYVGQRYGGGSQQERLFLIHFLHPAPAHYLAAHFDSQYIDACRISLKVKG